MRFNLTRFSLLNFFALNKKFYTKTLFIINFAIFLTVFAATSAIISLYVENKINEKEFELLETQRYQNYLHKMRSVFPMFHKSVESDQMFDRVMHNLNLFIDGTNFGDKVISNREYYFYRFHALIGGAYDIFEFDKGEDFGIEDIRLMVDTFYEEGEYKDMLNHEEIIKKYYYFQKKYEEFKKNTKDFEQYEAPTKYDLLKESGSVETYNKYKDYYLFAWDLNNWAIELLRLLEIIYLDVMEMQKSEMKNFNQEIIKLSKRESQLILSAFVLQLIIFFVIQFFEISSVAAETFKKSKQK